MTNVEGDEGVLGWINLGLSNEVRLDEGVICNFPILHFWLSNEVLLDEGVICNFPILILGVSNGVEVARASR